MKKLYEQLSYEQKELLDIEFENNPASTKIIIRDLKKEYYVTALNLGVAAELYNIFYGSIKDINLSKLFELFENK